MANSFEILKAKVSATNDVLKRKKVGVTIYIKKEGLVKTLSQKTTVTFSGAINLG